MNDQEDNLQSVGVDFERYGFYTENAFFEELERFWSKRNTTDKEWWELSYWEIAQVVMDYGKEQAETRLSLEAGLYPCYYYGVER